MRTRIVIAFGLSVAVLLALFSPERWSKSEPVRVPIRATPAFGKKTPVHRHEPFAAIESEPSPSPTPLPQEAEPAGLLILRGQVVNAQGSPVPEATVSISAAPFRTSKTDLEGRFTFDGLLPRGYQLRASSGAFVARMVEVQLGSASEPVTLVLQSGVTVEVTVLSAADRSPIRGAVVHTWEFPDLTATTAEDGTARLVGIGFGEVVVWSSAAGYAATFQALMTVEAVDEVKQVLLLMQPGAAVSGRVVDPTNTPVAGAHVRALPSSGNFVAASRQPFQSSLTDAQGRWTIAALPAGGFRFMASHSGFEPSLSMPVELDGKTPRQDITLTIDLGAQLSGRVVDSHEAPVAFATVEAITQVEGFGRGPVGWTTSDPQGAFQLIGLPHANVLVFAKKEGSTSATQPFDLSFEADLPAVTLKLEENPEIAGWVVTSEGAPLSGIQVVATPDSSNERLAMLRSAENRYASDITDAQGAFHLRGLVPSQYRVRASRQPVQAAARWLSSGVLATTGAKDLLVVLEEGGSLRGSVVRTDGRVPDAFSVALTLSPAVPFVGTHSAFELKDAPAGMHQVRISGPSLTTKRIENVSIVAGKETDIGRIEIEPGSAVVGRVIRTDGTPVAGATVTAGAQIPGEDNWRATTAENGSFQFPGLPVEPLVLIAEHPTEGQSLLTRAPMAEGDRRLDLTLLSHSSVQGIVTRNQRPIQNALVVALPQNAQEQEQRFIVSTQSDGRFKFEKLPAGPYLFSAAIPADTTGQVFQSLSAQVRGGETQQVDIELKVGAIALDVALVEGDGRPVQNALVYLSTKDITAPNLAQLEVATARGEGQTLLNLLLQERPVNFTNVVPGSYVLCAVPVRANMNDPLAIQHLRDHPGGLAVTCAGLEVAPEPARQHAGLRVRPG